jgi:mono/diheme cytochrome c family protein
LSVLVVALAALGITGGCSGGSDESEPRTGREIYVAVCQTCHGRTGGGFVGPILVDGAERYPDITDEIAVVTNGKGQMPAFGTQLSAEQIETVVAYTRAAFSTAPTTLVGPTLAP